MSQSTRSCSIGNCERKHKAHGYCQTHYMRFRRTGSPEDTNLSTAPVFCTVAGCESPHRSRGFCNFHYHRQRRFGDPLAVVRPYTVRRKASEHASWTDTPAYSTVHARLRTLRGQARQHLCGCGEQAKDWAYTHDDPQELTNSAGHPYSADITRYTPLCRSCHTLLDRGVKAGAR